MSVFRASSSPFQQRVFLLSCQRFWKLGFPRHIAQKKQALAQQHQDAQHGHHPLMAGYSARIPDYALPSTEPSTPKVPQGRPEIPWDAASAVFLQGDALISAMPESRSCHGSLVWLYALSPSAKLACGLLGFAQTHKGAALDPRRAFCPFETHSAVPWSGFVLFRLRRNSLAGCWALPRPTKALPLTREGLSALSKPVPAVPWSGFVLFRLRRNSPAGYWALPRPTRALPLTREGLSALSKPVLRILGGRYSFHHPGTGQAQANGV